MTKRRSASDQHHFAINQKYFFLALLTGVTLGTAVTLSRFAYLADASGIVVTLFRGVFMVLVLGIGETVALATALATFHGLDTAHAAVQYVGASLADDLFARTLAGASQD